MFEKLKQHAGHMIACVTYGKTKKNIVAVALECEDCNEVLLDYDK